MIEQHCKMQAMQYHNKIIIGYRSMFHHLKRITLSLLLPILFMGMLVACGGADKLPGKRIDVLGTKTALQVDSALSEQNIRLAPNSNQLNWQQYRGSAGHVSVNNQIAFERKRPLWRRKLGKGDKSGISLMAQPVIFADTLYWVDHKFRVSAHNLNRKGKKLWRIKLPIVKGDKQAYGGGMAVTSEAVIITTGAGFVYGLSRGNGQLLWQTNLRHPIHSTPTIEGNDIFITSINNITFALDGANGAVNWRHESVVSRVGLIQSISPAVSENIVVAGYANGEIVAINRADGETIWKQNLATSSRVDALGQIASVVAGFVVDGNRVYASSYSGKLVALDLRTGGMVWEVPLSASTPISLSGEYLFVLDDQSVLYAIATRSGKVHWVEELQNWEKGKEGYERIVWNGPLLAAPYLVVANHEKRLYLHDVATGKQVKRYKFGSGFHTHPISANGILYIIGSNGKLYALN